MSSHASTSSRAASSRLSSASERSTEGSKALLATRPSQQNVIKSRSAGYRNAHARSSSPSPSSTFGTSPSSHSSYVSFASLGVQAPEGSFEELDEEEDAAFESVETASVDSTFSALSRAVSIDSLDTCATASTTATSLFSSFSSPKIRQTLRSVASFFGAGTVEPPAPSSVPSSESASSILAASRREASPASPAASSILVDHTPAAASSLRPNFILDNYSSCELLHVIWGEVHPWQIMYDPTRDSCDGDYHLVHVPQAHPRFRLKQTIRRFPIPFTGGLLTRSAPFSSDGTPNARRTPRPSLKQLSRLENLRPSEDAWLQRLCAEVPAAYEGEMGELFGIECFCGGCCSHYS